MSAGGLLLIEGAEVFAPQALGRRDVLVGGGRVLAVAEQIVPPALGVPLQRVDGRGRWLLPGLVDSLVHLSGGGGEGGFASRTRPLEASQALRAGVTTLIGALGTDDTTRSHADLLATARGLAHEGLSAYALTGSYRVPVRTMTGSVRDDLVLIPDILGVGEIAIADHRGSQPDTAELARIAAESRVGGLLSGKAGTVLVHVGDGRDRLDPLRAVVAGHDVAAERFLPTHCNRSRALLDDAAAWAAAGGYADLTTSTTPELLAAGDIAAAEALRELLAEPALRGRITLSSDGQASLPNFDAEGRLIGSGTADIGSLLDTLRVVLAGRWMDFALALEAATSTPAKVWGLAQKGGVAAGMDADLLLVDPDGLRLCGTVAGGRLYRFDEAPVAAAA